MPSSDKKRTPQQNPTFKHALNPTQAAIDQKYQLNQDDLLEGLEEEKDEMVLEDLVDQEDMEATEVSKSANKNINQMKKPNSV